MFLLKMQKNNFHCLLKLDSLIKKFTSIYDTACDKLIMHCTYEAIILQHHQIQSSKGAREENGCSFAAILLSPPEWWNSFATFFFFFLTAAQEFFLLHLCYIQFFSSDKRLQEIFFSKSNHPPTSPSRVKWSAPNQFINRILWGTLDLSWL